MIQCDGEVLVVDATRCEMAARFEGWSGLASVGTGFVWVTGPARMQRIGWGEQTPDSVIENRAAK
jgi:hypothetical protein